MFIFAIYSYFPMQMSICNIVDIVSIILILWLNVEYIGLPYNASRYTGILQDDANFFADSFLITP